jgi:hypothetical protein
VSVTLVGGGGGDTGGSAALIALLAAAGIGVKFEDTARDEEFFITIWVVDDEPDNAEDNDFWLVPPV